MFGSNATSSSRGPRPDPNGLGASFALNLSPDKATSEQYTGWGGGGHNTRNKRDGKWGGGKGNPYRSGHSGISSDARHHRANQHHRGDPFGKPARSKPGRDTAGPGILGASLPQRGKSSTPVRIQPVPVPAVVAAETKSCSQPENPQPSTSWAVGSVRPRRCKVAADQVRFGYIIGCLTMSWLICLTTLCDSTFYLFD